MHDVGVVHLDIKSSNILIFSDRSAKLCDFGLARKGRGNMPVDRELITLWYRAPELLMGDSYYSPKVDEWGAGCVVLEMLIGTAPFKGKPDCVCSCSSVLHHNFNSDQLMKIFLAIGTPEDKSMISRMACYCHFGKWPMFPSKLNAMVRPSFQKKSHRKFSF
jgi:serine/threonine protein kinase